MTPQRKEYLAKCSNREKELRFNIGMLKTNLAVFKTILTKNGFSPIIKSSIKSTKCSFVAFRHELNRLKGMDRVVRPRDVRFGILTGTKYANCICGCELSEGKSFCSSCGRRILWEKVKYDC